MNASTDTTVWEWTPTLTGETAKKLRLVVVAGAVVDAAVLAGAVVTQSRFAIVLAAIVTSIGVLWFMEHRRLLSTRFSINETGMLTMSDSRSSVTAELTTAEKVEARHRGSGSGGISVNSRWSIEVVGPAGAVHHSLANVGGAFNLPEADITELESQVQAHVGRGAASTHASAGAAGMAETASSMQQHPQAAPSQPLGLADAVAADRFEWQPTISPNAERNRWLMRAFLILPAIGIAIYAVFAYRDEGIVAVLLSAATVPTMLLLAYWALSTAMRHGQAFRIVAENGELHVGRPGKAKTVPLTGSTVAVELRNQTTYTGTGTHVHGVRWDLDVTTAAGDERRFAFPTFGTATTRDDYIALERELQQRT